MQKVVCAACGLVNLESFPSFPQCAGCGARLPQRKRRPLLDFFRRPVKTLVWAFSIGAGVATMALLSVGIARETRIRDRGSLIVSSTIAPVSSGNFVLSLRVATSDPIDREPIRNLRLRLSQKEAREADVQIVSPASYTVEDLGGGRYFVWHDLAPRQTIKISLYPRRVLTLGMVANGFENFELRLVPTL